MTFLVIWDHSSSSSSTTSCGFAIRISVKWNDLVNFIPDQKLEYFKYVKDLGSFTRICFNLVTNILYLKQYRMQAKELREAILFMDDQPIVEGSEPHKKLKELLDARFQYRNAGIEVIHSTVIIIMLWKSLSFFGYSSLI